MTTTTADAYLEQLEAQKAEVLAQVRKGIDFLNRLGGSDIPDDPDTEGKRFDYSLRLGLRTVDTATGKLKAKVETNGTSTGNGTAKKKTKGK